MMKTQSLQRIDPLLLFLLLQARYKNISLLKDSDLHGGTGERLQMKTTERQILTL